MSRIQITSTQPPFDTPAIAARAARLLACADATGLLVDLAINQLDLPLLRTVVDRLAALPASARKCRQRWRSHGQHPIWIHCSAG